MSTGRQAFDRKTFWQLLLSLNKENACIAYTYNSNS